MEQYFKVALKAVKEAGSFLLKHFRSVSYSEAEEKKANDWVSFVDKGSENIIRKRILSQFPFHSFLGEEEGVAGIKSDCVWVVDPLDGTKNFLHGIDFFSISCALLDKGEPELGIVFNPARDELFYAIKGQGAFKNGEKINVSSSVNLERCLFATAFPFREKEKFDFLNNIFKKLYFVFSDVRRLGSAALDLCYVAEGIFVVFYEYGLSIWDIAAGSLIVEEAGGLVTDFQGGKEYLRTGNIVAGSEKAVTTVLEAIRGNNDR